MTPIVLGRYRLDEQVGQGGMAVVWRGFDTQLKRVVAVKVLHAHLLVREEMRRRFGREAHAVARLHHPHILDIYDFSGPEVGAGPSYLVTEFIPGWSLRAFADAHPFDPPELAACCALSLAEALEHAHAAQVVHRDLKPENVMVREDGEIKLTDFGIAALLDPDEKFTATGAILGSPAHLSPETIEGKPADPRSDLFSLGTVLYWLACGQLPFQARTPAALLHQILEGHAPDPRSLRPSVSDGLALVIARLLERDREKRFQTAAEAARALTAVLGEAGIDEPEKELAAFVAAPVPEQAALALRGRLVARSLEQGDKAMRARRTAAALAGFTRALALEPGNELASRRVRQIRNRTRAIKRAKMAGALLASLVLLAWLTIELGQIKRARAESARQQAAQAALASASREAASARQRADDAARMLAAQAQARDQAQTEGSSGTGLRAPGTNFEAPDAVAHSEAGSADGQARSSPTRASERLPADTTAHESSPIRPRHLAALHDAEPDVHPGRAQVTATLSVHWVWAHVLLDGVDLGEAQTFTRKLPAGPHQVTVSHACCLDGTQTLDIEPGQSRYALEPGKPKPARLSLRGAPPDALVLIDGVPMGASSTLAAHELPMTDRPSREVQLTVGDRSGRVTLQAGRTNELDYLKLAEGPAK